MSTAAQFNRLVLLVSELSRREREGEPDLEISEVARRLDVEPAQVQADLRALTRIGDSAGAEWLLSLRVALEGSRVMVSSGGPYRRPLRFTRDEVLALQLGLGSMEEDTGDLARRLTPSRSLEGTPPVAMQRPAAGRDWMLLVQQALESRTRLTLRYAGSGDRDGRDRVIQPHDLVSRDGHVYIVAWCERVGGWRHFRMDRVLHLAPDAGHFDLRSDFIPSDAVFQEPGDGVDEVQVRFGPEIARWIREQHPDADADGTGSVVVTYRVADPEWLVRHVLRFGAEAEVVSPPAYREMMRSAVEG